jgi:hypothetical protein
VGEEGVMAKYRFYYVVDEDDDGYWGSTDRHTVKREAIRNAKQLVRPCQWRPDYTAAQAHVYVTETDDPDCYDYDVSVDPIFTAKRKGWEG